MDVKKYLSERKWAEDELLKGYSNQSTKASKETPDNLELIDAAAVVGTTSPTHSLTNGPSTFTRSKPTKQRL